MEDNKKTIKSATEALKSLYPQSHSGNVQVSEADLQNWKSYDFAREEKQRWAELEEFYKLKCMGVMKENDKLKHGHKVLAHWKSRTICTVDRERLRINYPDVWRDCQNIQSLRYFMPNIKKQDKKSKSAPPQE